MRDARASATGAKRSYRSASAWASRPAMRSSNAWSDTFVSLLRTRSSLIGKGYASPSATDLLISNPPRSLNQKNPFSGNKRRLISVLSTLTKCKSYTNGGAMMGMRYMKAAPTTYVLHHTGGTVKREGAGLSFWYFAPTSVLAAVPLASVDVPFAFSEVAADFQAVTIQGQLTYRVADPRRLAGLLDFTVAPNGQYLSDDPATLSDRLVPVAQVLARAVTQRFSLREILTKGYLLVTEVLPALRKDPAVLMLGIEVLGLSILPLKPTPEMAKAREAEAREAL